MIRREQRIELARTPRAAGVLAFTAIVGVCALAPRYGESVDLAMLGGAGALVLLLAATVGRGLTGRLVEDGLLIGSAFLLPMNGVRLTEWMTAGDIALLCAFAVRITRLPSQPNERRGLDLAVVGPWVIVAGGLIGAFFAQQTTAAIANLGRFALSAAILPLVVVTWRPGPRQARAFAWAFVLGTAISGLTGLFFIRTYGGRALGLATHENLLGLTSVMASAVALAILLSARTRVERQVALIACVVLLASLLASGSRAALLAWLVLPILYLAVTRHGRFARLLVLGVIVAGFSVGLGVVRLPESNSIARAFDPTNPSAAASDAQRAEARTESVARGWKHPITGSGFESARAAHSLYLQVWVSAGLTGLVGLALTALAALLPLMRLIVRRDRHLEATHYLVLGFAAAFFAYLVAGVVSNSMWDRFIWVCLAMMACVLRQTTGLATEAISSTRVGGISP